MNAGRNMKIRVLVPSVAFLVFVVALVTWITRQGAEPPEGTGTSLQELENRAQWEKTTSLDENGDRTNVYSFNPKGGDGPVLLLFATVQRSGDQWDVGLLKSAEVQPDQMRDFLKGSGRVVERIGRDEATGDGSRLGPAKFNLWFLGEDLERRFKKMNIGHIVGLPGIGRDQLMESILAKTDVRTHYSDSATMLFEVEGSPEQICIAALW